MKKFFLVSSLLVVLATRVAAQPPIFTLQLDDAEAQAQVFSPALKAAQQETTAALAKAASQSALLWPRLSLEGSARYITEIPEFELALPVPNATPMVITMGDHMNYSIGVQLGWKLWDSFAIQGMVAALGKSAEAKALEIQAIRRNVLLKTRLAYFQTQLAVEQVGVLAEALYLAQAQNHDIRVKSNAGASSRIDSLASRMDVNERKKQLREARTTLAETLHQLLRLTGQTYDLDIQLPLGSEVKPHLLKIISQPTVLLQLDSMAKTKKKLATLPAKAVIRQHPNIQAVLKKVEAANQMARSAAAGYWPQIAVYAKSSLDYPNQAAVEQVRQNTAGASLSWTLWQKGHTNAQVREQKARARAGENFQVQIEMDLGLAWDMARDRVAQLTDVQKLNQQIEADARELVRLVYAAYRAGRVNYLEVQSANLRVLQAGTQTAVTEAQLLIQLALLNSLYEGETGNEKLK